METPILSKKQQRKSLSAKKQTPKSFRAILQTPREDYRPVVSVEQCKEIVHLIKSTFGTQNKSSGKIPWSLIKNVPKVERKEFRQKYREKHECTDNSLMKTHKCFVLGFNSTARLLEKDMLDAVLLESNIEQSNIMSNYLLRLCKLNTTPVIFLPDLRNIINASLKVRTMALGFKKINCCDIFIPLINKIKEFSNEYLKNHTNEKNKEKITNISERLNSDSKIIRMEVDSVSDVIQNKPKEELNNKNNHKFKDLYLYRDINVKSRIFVPKSNENEEKIEGNLTTKVESDDFIPFNLNTTSDVVDIEYKSMTIKRVTGNINRKTKRKK